MKLSSPTTRFRLVMVFFIVALVASGVTAFPLLTELRLLTRMIGIDDHALVQDYSGLQAWILTIRNGLEDTYARYPWNAYGTDWLAFGHITIALFFIGPLIKPLENRWVLQAGMIACAGVIPLALICGPLRGIPFYWRMIDCSFGVIGVIPLIYCLKLLPKIAEENNQRTSVS